jgi:hypothetical protein
VVKDWVLKCLMRVMWPLLSKVLCIDRWKPALLLAASQSRKPLQQHLPKKLSTYVTKFNPSYLSFGFTYAVEESMPVPQCVICCETLSTYSTKPSLLMYFILIQKILIGGTLKLLDFISGTPAKKFGNPWSRGIFTGWNWTYSFVLYR